METYKIKYNYRVSECKDGKLKSGLLKKDVRFNSYEDTNYWLTGCIIIRASTYRDAQDRFKAQFPVAVISDIELLDDPL